MNLYKVTRPEGAGYDEYDSFVCVAKSESSARVMHPKGPDEWKEEWKEEWSTWVSSDATAGLVVELLGVSSDVVERVVVASFNAG